MSFSNNAITLQNYAAGDMSQIPSTRMAGIDYGLRVHFILGVFCDLSTPCLNKEIYT
jgi:hypothetical protein